MLLGLWQKKKKWGIAMWASQSVYTVAKMTVTPRALSVVAWEVIVQCVSVLDTEWACCVTQRGKRGHSQVKGCTQTWTANNTEPFTLRYVACPLNCFLIFNYLKKYWRTCLHLTKLPRLGSNFWFPWLSLLELWVHLGSFFPAEVCSTHTVRSLHPSSASRCESKEGYAL